MKYSPTDTYENRCQHTHRRFYRGQDNTTNENLLLGKFRVMATSILPLIEKTPNKQMVDDLDENGQTTVGQPRSEIS
jgi:hypothetical protein